MAEKAGKLFGLHFTQAEADSMLEGLGEQLENYENIRKVALPNAVPPAFTFNPIPAGAAFTPGPSSFKLQPIPPTEMPADSNALAFYSIRQLAELIVDRKITSVQLTQFYINRLKKYGPRLECTITLTTELALQQARKADEEMAAGKYRGLLHGIPYGVKDLLTTKRYKTTWGAPPFKEQLIDEDATVVKRLEEAGAVLVAKLSLGELAMNNVWFGGFTRSPWDLSKGSSGSSAGSAAATAAGLVPFSIGSETWGSIVSPATVCGISGLRPTYGRVSRKGAMALSWTMDKIGPICRNAEDCAIVFNVIYGPDHIDETLYDLPFQYEAGINVAQLKIGYLKKDFDNIKNDPARKLDLEVLETLKKLGAQLVPIELPSFPVMDLSIILTAEGAAAFDELTRSEKDNLLVRQGKNAWPNIFRTSRFIPAVEYIQANRIRYLLIQEMDKLMKEVDMYVGPSRDGNNLLLTNLTGHPCVVVPNGFISAKEPRSISFTGKLFDEGRILALAKAYQDATEHHLKHPPLK